MADYARHPLNCPGPFYVVHAECMGCGAPEIEAGALMSHDGKGHCFFVRQPRTDEELSAAIRGLWASCCSAIRYSGQEPQVLIQLAFLDQASQCDHPTPLLAEATSYKM